MGMAFLMRTRKKKYQLQGEGVFSFEFLMAASESQVYIDNLFTRKYPMGFHKYAGLFLLCHFAFCCLQLIFINMSTRIGYRDWGIHGTSYASLSIDGGVPFVLTYLCLFPHTFSSISSIILHAVPRDRGVIRPMIWSYFLVQNIIFSCAVSYSLS